MPSNVNVSNAPVSEIMNFRVPCEGAKVIPLQLDFSIPPDGIFTLDLTQLEQQARFTMLQAIYVNMSGAGGDLTINVVDVRQVLIAKNNTQGFYAPLAPNPTVITFAISAGTPIITVHLINAPIPGVVWAV